MKIVALMMSLLVNVALAAMCLKQSRPAPSPSTPPAEQKSEAAPTVAKAGATKSGDSRGDAPENVTAFWPKAGDLSDIVAKLRAQGFPPNMMRAVVRALVAQQNKPKWRELQKDDAPLWKLPTMWTDPKRIAAQRELTREQNRTINDLLGPDAQLAPDEIVTPESKRRFGDIAPEKLQKAQELLRDYNDLRSDVFVNAQGGAYAGPLILLPEDRDQLNYLAKQQRDDLAKLLTPEELLDYDLRSSGTANRMRNDLVGFHPIAEEFKALFQLQQAMDEQLGSSEFGGSELNRKRQAALKELQPQIEAALGPERAAEYKQATEPQFQMANRIVARLDLPASAAVEVLNVQKDIQQRANTIRGNASLSTAEKATQLSALSNEATTKVSTALGGTRGLEAYKQYGGAWLQNLTPRAPARN